MQAECPVVCPEASRLEAWMTSWGAAVVTLTAVAAVQEAHMDSQEASHLGASLVAVPEGAGADVEEPQVTPSATSVSEK